MPRRRNVCARCATSGKQREDHIAITVSDVKKSSDWYKELFGLVPEQDTATAAVLGFGNTVLVLRPGQNPGRLTHFCFGVKGFNLAQAEAELRKRGLTREKTTKVSTSKTRMERTFRLVRPTLDR